MASNAAWPLNIRHRKLPVPQYEEVEALRLAVVTFVESGQHRFEMQRIFSRRLVRVVSGFRAHHTTVLGMEIIFRLKIRGSPAFPRIEYRNMSEDRAVKGVLHCTSARWAAV